MSKRVFMLVGNPVLSDPRVMRASQSLAKRGHTVAVGGIAPSVQQADVRKISGVDVIRWPPSLIQQAVNRASTQGTNRALGPSGGAASRRGSSVGSLRRTLKGAMFFAGTVTSLFTGTSTVREFRPDVIHAHDLNALVQAVLLAKKCGAKVIYDSHEIWSEMGSYASLYRSALRSLEKKLLRDVELVITVSEGIADLFVKWYKVDRPLVVLNVPNVTPIEPQARSCRQVDWLYHGGLTPTRGLELLITAFSLLPSHCPARLTIRGDGPLKSRLKAIVDESGTSQRFVFADSVPMDQVVQFAARADIGVIPFLPMNLNNALAMPNKLFEYLAAGLAIWCPEDLREVKKLVESCGSGAVYRLEGPQGVACQLAEFLDEADILEMRRKAYIAAKEQFSWHGQEKKLCAIYQRI